PCASPATASAGSPPTYCSSASRGRRRPPRRLISASKSFSVKARTDKTTHRPDQSGRRRSISDIRGITHARVQRRPVLTAPSLGADLAVYVARNRPHQRRRIEFRSRIQGQAEILVRQINHEAGRQVIL